MYKITKNKNPPDSLHEPDGVVSYIATAASKRVGSLVDWSAIIIRCDVQQNLELSGRQVFEIVYKLAFLFLPRPNEFVRATLFDFYLIHDNAFTLNLAGDLEVLTRISRFNVPVQVRQVIVLAIGYKQDEIVFNQKVGVKIVRRALLTFQYAKSAFNGALTLSNAQLTM